MFNCHLERIFSNFSLNDSRVFLYLIFPYLNTNFLLIVDSFVFITFEPQCVHDSRIEDNHYSHRNDNQNQTRQTISRGHPLLRPTLNTVFAAFLLVESPSQE